MNKLIQRFADKPKSIFLVDAIGAFLTAFLLFVVLTNWTEYFGMPVIILNCLAATAVCFCLYSTSCFLFLKGNWPSFIRAISIANVLYCMVTAILIILYYRVLKPLGIVYFSAEIALVCGLVWIELRIAKTIRQEPIR